MLNLISESNQLVIPPLLGIGEYAEGFHWKDQPLSQRISDVFKAFLKVTITSLILGAIVFGCAYAFTQPSLSMQWFSQVSVSVILTISITSAVALAGIALIARTISLAHSIEACSSQPDFPKQNPMLGQWTENEVLLTRDGSESMEMKLRLIANAEHSIEISGSYCGGEIFDTVLQLIYRKLKANPNLKIRIITNNSLLTSTNCAYIKEIANTFPNNFYALITEKKFIIVPSLRTIENHTKLLIVDGCRCVTGGTGLQDLLSREGSGNKGNMNASPSLNESVLGAGARDMDVVISGPQAEIMRCEFYRLLSKWNWLTSNGMKHGSIGDHEYQPIERDVQSLAGRKNIYREKLERVVQAPTMLISGSHEHGTNHGCKLAYIHMIRQAKKSIIIANMSINQPEVIKEISDAAQRGVKITIITNGPGTTLSSAFIGSVNRAVLNKLFPLVTCYEYNQEATLYHKKVMLIDDRISVIGSFNISLHCSTTEDEDIAVINSEVVAAQLLQNLQEDIKRSKEFTGSLKCETRWFKFKKAVALGLTAHIFQ